MTLALGHFTVDMYSGMIPILYPLFTDKFDLSLSRVGFISLAYSGASSVLATFFGHMADRRGHPIHRFGVDVDRDDLFLFRTRADV